MDAEQPVFIDLGSGWYIMNETARRIAVEFFYDAAKYFTGKNERDAAQAMLENPTEPKAPAPPDEPAQPPAPAGDMPAGMVRLASVLNSRRRPE